MAVTFGSTLREHRMAHGLTQEALAERALLSPTAIAALERGRNRAPRMSTLHQLAKALELEPEEMADLARTLNATPTTAPPEERADGRDPSSAPTELPPLGSRPTGRTGSPSRGRQAGGGGPISSAARRRSAGCGAPWAVGAGWSRSSESPASGRPGWCRSW